ncbi:MAG: phosphoribosyltransferase [Gammaproteobacteria bacterium]
MRFRDRLDAAAHLAGALAAWRGSHPLVLAIPRGAVPMGRAIADALHADFDVVLVRKLGAPFSPEFAVGAVDETGWVYLAPHARQAGAGAEYIERERAEQLRTLRQRRAAYTPKRAPLDPSGRVVIVVDDGLATGATMIAALHAVRARGPARLVCAVPVAAPDSLEAVRPLADDVVCLYAPENFDAVGRFYEDFGQVEDDEVIRILSQPPEAAPA